MAVTNRRMGWSFYNSRRRRHPPIGRTIMRVMTLVPPGLPPLSAITGWLKSVMIMKPSISNFCSQSKIDWTSRSATSSPTSVLGWSRLEERQAICRFLARSKCFRPEREWPGGNYTTKFVLLRQGSYNNGAERALRAAALGRDNYLFAGPDAGGERAACHLQNDRICQTDRPHYAGLLAACHRTHRKSSGRSS